MGRIVLAYHGCDITTRDGFVRGEIKPKNLKQPVRLAGRRTLFFEGDWNRTLKLAEFSHNHSDLLLTREPIAKPAVAGAVLEVDRWLDLTTHC